MMTYFAGCVNAFIMFFMCTFSVVNEWKTATVPLLFGTELKFTVLFQGSPDRHAHGWKTSTSALTSPPPLKKLPI